MNLIFGFLLFKRQNLRSINLLYSVSYAWENWNWLNINRLFVFLFYLIWLVVIVLSSFNINLIFQNIWILFILVFQLNILINLFIFTCNFFFVHFNLLFEFSAFILASFATLRLTCLLTQTSLSVFSAGREDSMATHQPKQNNCDDFCREFWNKLRKCSANQGWKCVNQTHTKTCDQKDDNKFKSCRVDHHQNECLISNFGKEN